MGRAGRPKNEMPPGLEELEEHGVPEGWQRYWHGQKDQVTERKPSEVFPGIPLSQLRSLYFQPWPEDRIIKLLRSAEAPVGDLRQDEVMRGLFENEIMRLHSWGDRIEKATGRHSILRKLDKENLWKEWSEEFLTNMADEINSGNSGHLPYWTLLHHLDRACQRGNKKGVVETLRKDLQEWYEKDPGGFYEFAKRESLQMFARAAMLEAISSTKQAQAIMHHMGVQGSMVEILVEKIRKETPGLRESELLYLHRIWIGMLADKAYNLGVCSPSEMTPGMRDRALEEGLRMWLQIELQERSQSDLFKRLAQVAEASAKPRPGLNNTRASHKRAILDSTQKITINDMTAIARGDKYLDEVLAGYIT